jgi:hypothetical protein
MLNRQLEKLFYIRPAADNTRCKTVRNPERHHSVSARCLFGIT